MQADKILPFFLQASSEKSKKLENLGTVMTLYSRRTFSKESFQWTKCVVKYLHDTYSHLSLNMLTFLVEVSQRNDSRNFFSIRNLELICLFFFFLGFRERATDHAATCFKHNALDAQHCGFKFVSSPTDQCRST